MPDTFVIVESPLRGHPQGYAGGKKYARVCLKDSIDRDEIPWMSHLLYTQALNDTIPEERTQGIDLHLEMITLSTHMPKAMMAVYGDFGISEGMQKAIDFASEIGVDVIHRLIMPMTVVSQGDKEIGYACCSCGGYGYVYDSNSLCQVCPDSCGIINFDDPRIKR